jgi:hypothetical protein
MPSSVCPHSSEAEQRPYKAKVGVSKSSVGTNVTYSSIVLRVIRLTVNQEESDSISDAGAKS